MKTGTVRWFNARKGYGFLKPADGGFDVFVHVSAVEGAGIMELKEGQRIGFEIVVDERSGETFADNLKALPNPPAGLNGSPGTLESSSGRKASWFGGPPWGHDNAPARLSCLWAWASTAVGSTQASLRQERTY